MIYHRATKLEGRRNQQQRGHLILPKRAGIARCYQVVLVLSYTRTPTSDLTAPG